MTPLIPKQAIAKIVVADPTAGNAKPLSIGTGFLVAPGLVLTACHVVGIPPDPYPGEITLIFPAPGGKVFTTKASVYQKDNVRFWNKRLEWALLQCETPPPNTTPFSLLNPQTASGDMQWRSYGFPEGKSDGCGCDGTVTDLDGNVDGAPAIQLFSKEAAGFWVRGWSGSPVLVQDAAIGILRFSIGTKERLGDRQVFANRGGILYACSTAAAWEELNKLQPGLIPKPDLFKPARTHTLWTRLKDATLFLGRLCKILTRPPWLRWIQLAAVLLVLGIGYFAAVQLIEGRAQILAEIVPLDQDEGNTLDASRWTTSPALKWQFSDSNRRLEVSTPGWAVFTTGRGRSFYDFLFVFDVQFDAGRRISWVLGAQSGLDPSKAALEFDLQTDATTQKPYVVAYRLPARTRFGPRLDVKIPDFGSPDAPFQGLLKIENRIARSRLRLSITRVATSSAEMRLPYVGFPFSEVFTDLPFDHGTIGLFAPDNFAGRVFVSNFRIAPKRRWYLY